MTMMEIYVDTDMGAGVSYGGKGDAPMTSEAQKRARIKYDNTHTMQVKMKLNTKTDADIIEKLNSLPNKQGYIKTLIRNDLK